MNKNINRFTLLFYILFSSVSISQNLIEDKFRISFEYGYFGSNYFLAENGGDYLNTSFGYKINDDFWLSLDLIKLNATGNYESTTAGTIENNFSMTMFIPNFSKDWRVSKKSFFKTTLGASFILEKAYVPFVSLANSEINLSYENFNNEFDLGLFVNIGYLYEVHQNLYLGINFKTYAAIYLNPDSLFIGPSIEFRL